MMRHLLCAGVLLACAAVSSVPRAEADDTRDRSRVPPAEHVETPDLFRAKLAQVDAILGHRGLKRGEVYEISRERMYAYLRAHASHIEAPADYVIRFGRGRVFSQNPRGGKAVPKGAKIDIVLIARNDGKVPPHPHFQDLEVLALPGERRVEEPAPAVPAGSLPLREPATSKPASAEPAPSEPAPSEPAPNKPGPSRPGPSQPGPEEPVAPPPTGPSSAPASVPEEPTSGASPLQPTAAGPDRLGPTPRADAPVAKGSPEAPREAGRIDPNLVPRLIGLDLVDAETLASQVGLELYVERVPGHPVGRVLRQIPASGTAKPQGNVVKVTATAGGDFEAATPEAPAVYVTHVRVPDLLDRTKLQAQRILEDLGLVVTEEVAKRGMPGRVVDQRPAMGAEVRKGSIVVIRVGPGELPKPLSGPYRPPAETPESAASGPASTGKPGAPRAISPTASTRLPTDATIPMGFSWSKVKDATAYLLEVEEQTAKGGWLANTRKPVRHTAVTLELERLDTRTPRAFRWRVRAVLADRQGPASEWVELR